MGMYDNITIYNQFLPRENRVKISEQDFQTKSFNCLLEYYHISNNGYLFQKTKMKQGWNHDKCNEKVNFTGSIEFYDMDNDFVAFFEKGKLLKLIKI
jgi:hypothetical protein